MKNCAFCLRPAKMSGEHIWSAWMGRLFSGSTEFDFSKYSRDEYKVEWATDPSAKTWKSKNIDAVANVVCDPCNNGWMSDIDDEASATMSHMILHGSALSLLPLGIAAIARFAYKASVVVDSTRTRAAPFFPPAERKRFSEGKHDVPSATQVWLSTIRTDRVHGRYLGHYAKIKTGHYRNFRVYVFTYTIGFLVIQLSAIRWGSRVLTRPRFTPYFRQAAIWTPVSVPLWPPDGRPVVWPTKQFFTDENVNQLAERWSHVSERRIHD